MSIVFVSDLKTEIAVASKKGEFFQQKNYQKKCNAHSSE
jgi:hypothetical protein